MVKFILRRMLGGVVLVAVIVTLTFFLLHLGSGDVGRTILGPQATAETVAAKNAQLGLDKPVLDQFLSWVANAVQGDLGRSWYSGTDVTSSIVGRLGVTVSLVFGATVVSGIIAIVLGSVAALRKGVADAIVQVLSVVGFAVPSFVVAILLVNVFALDFGLFPATGYVPPMESLSGSFMSTFLPITALSIGAVAAVAQQVRGAMLETLEAEWVRTLRSRGLAQRRIVFRHVLRNAAGPALAVLAVQFVGLLGGAVIIEKIFAIPGLGQVSVLATSQSDVPLVLGLVVAIAVIVIIVNLAIDILQGILNPKVRLS